METRIQENLDHETETLYMAALSENVEELDPLPPFCCFIPTDYSMPFSDKIIFVKNCTIFLHYQNYGSVCSI